MSTKPRISLYFVTLGLFALAMLGSGVMNVLQPPQLVESLSQLGYPPYLLTIIGVWKLLGALAIAVPGLPRLKEWAYAGFTFELSGAVISHLVSGDGPGKAAFPLALLALGLTSWALRPSMRRLSTAAQLSART
jgi:uncharacterized membrane protein YphA (DoxX/SURF4 family)